MLSRMRQIWGSAGFTLMELLVVVTIIMILASMLMPSLQQAREKAKYARWVGYSRNLCCEPNLVAYWTFEEGEGDILKNKAVGSYGDISYRPKKVNGEIVGASWVTDGGRWPGKSTLHFINKDEYVVFPKGTTPRTDRNTIRALELEGNATFEVWVKRSQTDVMRLFVADYPGGRLQGMNYCLYVQAGDPRFIWGSRDGTDFDMIYNCKDAQGNSVNVADGKWHHIVAVIDYPDAHMYIDGEEMTVTSFVRHGLRLTLPGGGGEWTGEYVRCVNYYHVNTNGGYIDELAVYNRALTSAEVKAHYKMGKP